MDGFVAQRFLGKRFWIATLLLLVSLAASAATAISLLRSQAERTDYIVAFQKLSEAASWLEVEVVRLSMLPEGALPDRSAMHAAFVALLTEFRAISVSDLDEHLNDEAGATGAARDDHLAGLAREFGVDSVSARARRRLAPMSLPAEIEALWEPGPGDLPVALEVSLAQVLRLSASVLRDHDVVTGAERRVQEQIKGVMKEEVRPLLTRVVRVLEVRHQEAGSRAYLLVALVTGLGLAAIALVGVAIFIPVQRAVLRSQAELIAERDRAVESDSVKRRFLSLVSHELRTPMNGMLGFASLLLSSDLKPEHCKQVEIIQSSGRSLLALVNDILDFSKLEAGSVQLEDEDFSVEEVVSDVVSLLQGAAVAKSLDIGVRFDGRLPGRVRGDGHRLRQVLTNLVGNAIKFTDSGSIGIEVSALENGAGPGGRRALRFSVSDTGIGIPADQCERIFEQFTQVDSNSRRRSEGTGLGLAICRQLVEMMGGRIWVDSTPGAGSTFHVRIPVGDAEPAAQETNPKADAVAPPSGRRLTAFGDSATDHRIPRLRPGVRGARVGAGFGAPAVHSPIDRRR